MSGIDILGERYEFPEIQDDSFNALRRRIEEKRELIAEGSKERKVLGVFKRPATLDSESQLRLTEELVAHYDELVNTLKDKIGICNDVFMHVGDGVRGYFATKLAELAAMESRRLAELTTIEAQGQSELVGVYESEKLRIRGLTINLTKATILIIRKLRHGLEAMEILVDDEITQRNVLDSLKGNITAYRRAHEFRKDLDKIEEDIAAATDFALDFESLLREKLGPLAVLIEEISKVDSRVADSLAEIQKLSLQLESRKAVTSGLRGFDDSVFEAFLRGQMRKDAISGVLSAMSDPEADWGQIDFEVELSGESRLDFDMLATNMGQLVRYGLEDLRTRGPSQAIPAPVETAGPASVQDEIDIEITPSAAFLTPREELSEPEKAEAEASPAPQAVTAVPSEELSEAPPEPELAQADSPPTAKPATSAAAPLPWVEAAGRAGSASPQQPIQRGEYRTSISRADPALLVFLLDRSGSMGDSYAGGLSKAQYLSKTVDATLMEMAVRCHKAEGTRDYFHIACIGYGDGAIKSAFAGSLGSGDYATISSIAANPLRLVDESAGGKRPQWIEPLASGDTPMCAAFAQACRFVAHWCDQHPRSYPPTVINVSDGEATDGDPRQAAEVLRRLHTDDGECLVFNLHVSQGGGGEVVFPDSPAGLGEHARRLYDISSPFPPHLLERAKDAGFRVGPSSRFFAWGAGADLATRFFELGTRPAKLS